MSLFYLELDKYWIILGFPFKSCKHYWTCTSGTMLGYTTCIAYDINQHTFTFTVSVNIIR